MINLGTEEVTAHGVKVAAGAIATIAGGANAGFSGDEGPAVKARVSYLPGIGADPRGILFLADERHHRIRRIDDKGKIDTIAGTGGTRLKDGGFNGNERPATGAG